MEKIIKIATKELGVREIKGPKHNPRILKYAKDTKMSWVKTDETPWCSIFVNWVCQQAKFESSGKANARSWLKAGFKVVDPEPGDIVVYWRNSKSSPAGHVGIFLGFSVDKSRIYTLGGNQGDAVSISGYSIDRLLEFRRLRKTNIKLSNDTLKKGDSGSKVVALQDALKMAGFNCGTSDGAFGPRTERAVKELQDSSKGVVKTTGIFNKATKDFLKSLLE